MQCFFFREEGKCVTHTQWPVSPADLADLGTHQDHRGLVLCVDEITDRRWIDVFRTRCLMKTVRLSCDKKMVLEPEFEIPLFYNEITSVRLVSVTERLKSRSRPSSFRCSFILCLRAESIFICLGVGVVCKAVQVSWVGWRYLLTLHACPYVVCIFRRSYMTICRDIVVPRTTVRNTAYGKPRGLTYTVHSRPLFRLRYPITKRRPLSVFYALRALSDMRSVCFRNKYFPKFVIKYNRK